MRKKKLQEDLGFMSNLNAEMFFSVNVVVSAFHYKWGEQ